MMYHRYYDRFFLSCDSVFAEHPNSGSNTVYQPEKTKLILSVALAFNEQIVDQVPMSPTDQWVDIVVTPEALYRHQKPEC